MTGRRAPPFLACLASALALSWVAVPAFAEDVDACIAASEKGLALRREGKLEEARALLLTCAAESCPSMIRTVCEQRLAKLRLVIPTIAFDVKPRDGRPLPPVTLTIDDVLYTERLTAVPIELDPGTHRFRFDVPGEPPFVVEFVLEQGGRERREEIVLGPAPLTPPVAATLVAAGPPPARWLTAPRAIGLGVSSGLAVVAAATGAVTGLLAVSKSSQARAGCLFDGTMERCTEKAASEMNEAKRFATASDVSFGVAAVGAVGAAVLFLLRPHADPAFDRAHGASAPAFYWDLAASPHGTQGFVGYAF